MSYTQINGMRSARYPLQGCGCGCGGTGACRPSLSGTGTTVGSVATAAVVGLGLIWLLKQEGGPVANRRRRRRRRRR